MKNLKSLIQNNEFFLGLFYKTPSSVVAEVLSQTDLDVIVLDTEHAPFDRLSADQCISIFRLAGKPVLARPPSTNPEYIQYLLDSGATGILAPHINSVERAKDLVDACLYGKGRRGYSGSTRAAQFGKLKMEEYINYVNQNVVIIAMIEDLDAIDKLDDIFQVEGIDAFFIGRADLAASMGETSVLSESPMALTEKILDAAKKANKSVGMLAVSTKDAAYWRLKGAKFFFMSSDQALLIQAANALVADVNATSDPH
jgi:2-keto-3-deoxy-L-rhamnonate aldolase RhmA